MTIINKNFLIKQNQMKDIKIMLSIQLNQQLCVEEGTYTHAWCFYQAFDDYSIVVSHCFLCTVILVFILATRNFYKLLKVRNGPLRGIFGTVYMLVYSFIYIWLISCIIKITINLVIYYKYMRQDFIGPPYDGNDDFPVNEPIVYLSSIFLFFDYMTGVALLSIFWLICYQWLNQILQNTRQRESLKLQYRKTIDIMFKVLHFAKYFNFTVRVLFVVFLILEPFLLFFTSYGCSLPKINAIYFYIDSFLVFCFYIFGHFVWQFMKKYSLESIQPLDKRKMEVQYFLLLTTLICRMILNFIFKISNVYKYDPINKNCSDPNHKITTIIFLTLNIYLLQALPIISTLYVYRPDIKSGAIRSSIRYDEILERSETDNEISRSLLLTMPKQSHQDADLIQYMQNKRG